MGEGILLAFLSILYGVVLLGIIQYVVFKRVYKSVFFTYIGYAILSILYGYVNIEILPEFKGFTGGFRIGTDDCRFFLQVVDVSFSLPIFCYSLTEVHNFSKLLNFLYPFDVIHPFQIVAFNCVGISLIPLLGKKIYESYFPEDGWKVRVIYWLLWFSPSILSNGLILIRDGWTAQLFLLFIYLLVTNRKTSLVLASAVILVFLRPGFIVFPVLFFVVERFYLRKLFLVKMLCVFLIALPLMSYILNSAYGVDIAKSLIRDDYVEGFLGEFGDESMLYRIMLLPFPVNVAISFLFFFTSPFLKIDFYNSDILVIRRVFVFFEALLMAVMVPLFILNVKKHWNENANFRKLVIFLVLSILLLCTISLQARHKLIVLPLLYMVFLHTFKFGKYGGVLVIMYMIFQLVVVPNIS